MFRLFTILVRTSYLIAVLVSLVFLVPWVVADVASLYRPAFPGIELNRGLATPLLVLAVFVVPATRALLRLIRRADLIREDHLREAPVVSTLVFLASTCASFLFLNLAWAFLTHAGRDVELAPFVFFGAIWLALALLIGEIVLVGRRNA